MNKKLSGLIFWTYLIILLIATVSPWSNSQKVLSGGSEFRLDYFLHLGAYFGLGVLYVLWQFDILGNLRLLRVVLHIFLLLIFSFSTEAVQLYLPYRIFNYKDFIANSIGVFAGVGIFFIFRNPILNINIK